MKDDYIKNLNEQLVQLAATAKRISEASKKAAEHYKAAADILESKGGSRQ